MARFFTYNVRGFESVEKDVLDEIKDIDRFIQNGLQMVDNEFHTNLAKHVHEDWYKKWGPPKEYERRTDEETLGTPIGSMDPPNMDSNLKKRQLTFIYSPSGEHKYEGWHSVDGDQLIKIIQDNKGWEYEPNFDKEGRKIMPRPFWNNFVEEEFNGAAFDAFEYGFHNSAGNEYVLVREGGTKDLQYEPGEGLL